MSAKRIKLLFADIWYLHLVVLPYFTPLIKKKITSIPFQPSCKTNVKGEFSNLFAGTFTIIAADAWGTPSNDVEIPANKLKVGSSYDSDKTFSNTYDNTKTCIGIVYVVNVDGTTGKIVSLDEAPATNWSTERIDTGAASDSAESTSKVLDFEK